MKLFNWSGIRVVRCANESPVILVLLEFGWNICCDIALSFESKILCFIVRCEGVARDFTFSTIVFRITDIVTCEVVQSLTMTNKDWRCYCNGFSLFFKAVIGIGPVDDPLSNVCLQRMHACFLVSGNWRVNLRSMWCAAQVEWLLKDVWIWFNNNLLTIADDIVRSKHVKLLGFLDNEDWTSDWTCLLLCCGKHVCFVNLVQTVSSVHNECSFCCLVSEHKAVTLSDATVSTVRPWHLFMILVIGWHSFTEW